MFLPYSFIFLHFASKTAQKSANESNRLRLSHSRQRAILENPSSSIQNRESQIKNQKSFTQHGVPNVTIGCGGESGGSGAPASLRSGVPGRGRLYAAKRHLMRAPCRTRLNPELDHTHPHTDATDTDAASYTRSPSVR